MQATAGGLWILDQATNQVSLISYSGEILKTFDTASDKGSGITDSGSELWLASTYNCQIIKANRETGATLAQIDIPEPFPECDSSCGTATRMKMSFLRYTQDRSERSEESLKPAEAYKDSAANDASE